MQYRHYNTGDQIWVRRVEGHEVVAKVLTSDGFYWEEDMFTPIKLTGAEFAINFLVVQWIRLVHKVLA